MSSAALLTDAFGRIRETVLAVVPGLTPEQLARRLDPDANPVGWLVWHLARVTDDHVAAAFNVRQEWENGGWADRFGLPSGTMEIGYGHTSAQVAAIAEKVSAHPNLLTAYHEAAHELAVKHVSTLKDSDLSRVVDEAWDPPVTLGVRLVSVVNDATQHVGQAAFVKGILDREP